MTAIQQQSSPNTQTNNNKPVAQPTSSFPNTLHPSTAANTQQQPHHQQQPMPQQKQQPCQQIQPLAPPALQTHAVAAQGNTDKILKI